MLIRPAIDTDSEFIVQLIQQSFDAHILDAMIYGCHGIENYVRACILAPDKITDTVYFVAENDHRIVGCIELRLIGKVIFLNYICTEKKIRHKGLGSELLRKAIQLIGTTSYDKMSLDVFHDNLVAKTWYEKLGFISEYDTVWWSIPMVDHPNAVKGKISGIAHANVSLREFGFSQFSLSTETTSYNVGKMGCDWFRISQEGLLNDDQALATLYQLEPARKILGLFRENAMLPSLERAKLFCRSARMSANLDSLLINLITE
jgi:GNAT superfamily N-acetyltransferase